MRVIGVYGKAESGKSTLAGFLASLLNEMGYTTAIDGFAVGVKREARRLGWDGQKDDKGRELLQTIGHGRRIKENDRCWINDLVTRWASPPHSFYGVEHKTEDWACEALTASDRVDFLIVSDVRYDNEIDLMLRAGVLWVKEGKPLDNAALAAHPSESAVVDLSRPGVVLMHRAPTLEELKDQVKDLLAEGLMYK